MKKLLIAVGGVVFVTLGATMAATNPGQAEYEEYATGELVNYLKENCREVSGLEFLQPFCTSLIDSNRLQLKQLIAQQTQRQSFLLFSIYQTDLAIAALPGYHVEVVGVFQRFYIYNLERL